MVRCRWAWDVTKILFEKKSKIFEKQNGAIYDAKEVNWARSVNLSHNYVRTLTQNPGYYDITAEDMSVWHIPNNLPLEHWNQAAAAILRYHTENQFLTLYGGNLFQLFKVIKALKNLLICKFQKHK